MRKNLLVILLCLGVCLTCAACSDTPVAAESEASIATLPKESVVIEEKTLPEVPLVSRAYFLENCGYGEDDLVGVDIDEFITECSIVKQVDTCFK